MHCPSSVTRDVTKGEKYNTIPTPTAFVQHSPHSRAEGVASHSSSLFASKKHKRDQDKEQRESTFCLQQEKVKSNKLKFKEPQDERGQKAIPMKVTEPGGGGYCMVRTYAIN